VCHQKQMSPKLKTHKVLTTDRLPCTNISFLCTEVFTPSSKSACAPTHLMHFPQPSSPQCHHPHHPQPQQLTKVAGPVQQLLLGC
jgi:hypothetical protein